MHILKLWMTTGGVTRSRSQSYERDARVYADQRHKWRASVTHASVRRVSRMSGAFKSAFELHCAVMSETRAERMSAFTITVSRAPRHSSWEIRCWSSTDRGIDTDDLSWWPARRWGWGGWWWWRAWITRVISSTVTVWPSRKLWFYRSRTTKASGLCCEELKVRDIIIFIIFIIIISFNTHHVIRPSDSVKMTLFHLFLITLQCTL